MKKIKHLTLLTTIIIILIVSSINISNSIFGVSNPFITFNGFIQIYVFNKDYYEIQEYPKNMIANKDLDLVDYMKNLGWKYVNTINQNNYVIYEFEMKDTLSYVEVHEHKNFFVWTWRE